MPFDLGTVHWPAVAAAGVAAFMLGGMWYSAIFGKLWIELMGYTPEKVAEIKAKMSPAKFLGGMVVCYVILAIAVSLLVGALNLKGPAQGAALGFILWFGPAAAIGFTGHLASERKLGIYVLDAGFQLVALLTQGIILASWR
jgi:hypothetical protein